MAESTETAADDSSGEQQSNSRFYKLATTIGVGFLALGQWGDTKDVLTDAWVLGWSHFSHKYEYEALDKIQVGSNLEYVKTHFGQPKLIKKSKYSDHLNFAYYLEDKFILSLILDGERVNGYTVTALEQDFVPSLLQESESAANNTVSAQYQNISDFTLDFNNVEYLLIREELGKDKLFINQYSGAIGYHDDINVSEDKLRALYNSLNLDEENPEILKETQQLTKQARNNFYGVGEVDLSVVADSVLTNFEYSLYYKK